MVAPAWAFDIPQGRGNPKFSTQAQDNMQIGKFEHQVDMVTSLEATEDWITWPIMQPVTEDIS